MEITIDRHDGLEYVAINGLDKTKKNEIKATRCVTRLLKKRMIYPYTLNIWKDDILLIRYATTEEELSILFDAILSDRQLPKTHEERSLLY